MSLTKRGTLIATHVSKRETLIATHETTWEYGVATISRLLKVIGIFCRIMSLLYGSFAKETHNIMELTNRSHPIMSVVRDTLTKCNTLNECLSRRFSLT